MVMASKRGNASTSGTSSQPAKRARHQQKFMSVLNGHGEEIQEPCVRRDSRGGIVFDDFPSFRPNLTPKEVIAMGSFGGCYFHPRGGKPGILSPKKGVDVSH